MIQTIDISKWDIVEERKNIAGFVKQALCTQGVFYATGHKISPELVSSLFTKSKEFFSLEIEYKSTIDVKLSGPAIRGYFCADNREGLCFGSEDGASHALVVSGSILHGQNSFPQRPASIGPVVLAWQQAAKELGQTLLEIFSVALGQEPTFLHNRFAQDPLILTRIFNYFVRDENIAMDKHTDFSFFTLLQQDDVGGLQVHFVDLMCKSGTFDKIGVDSDFRPQTRLVVGRDWTKRGSGGLSW
jgi:isopenicillin N synthase-like dioxygenase